ncbi:carbohydrate kinase, partial [Aestuariivirga sp.]|uniref:carbohydrate kinase family protein n=1 Tax=Aestuariivirga sp. TaxID=2650926 RepID=UPI0035946471
RLGRSVGMLGKLGQEAFGTLIRAALDRYGVDTSGVVMDPEAKTRLSVVSLAPDGERSFIFYKDTPADSAVDSDDILPAQIEGARLLHVGSLLMASPRAAAAQVKALDIAASLGRPISLDPNFRLGLWPDKATMVAAGRGLVARAAIVKLSEEELAALAGEGPIEPAVRSLWHVGMKILAVTRGARGAELITREMRFTCHGYAVSTIDTLAAGDAFMASLLSGLLEIGLDTMDGEPLSRVLRQACAAGAIATTRKGAMESLPTPEEIERLLWETPENLP